MVVPTSTLPFGAVMVTADRFDTLLFRNGNDDLAVLWDIKGLFIGCTMVSTLEPSVVYRIFPSGIAFSSHLRFDPSW